MDYPAFKIKSSFWAKHCFFLRWSCNKYQKCATLSLYCTFGGWTVVKGTWFTTHKEDVSIKRELAPEHHQVLPSSVACTRRTESKWRLAPQLKTNTGEKKHTNTCCRMQQSTLMVCTLLKRACKCTHTHTQTHTHTHTFTTHVSCTMGDRGLISLIIN